MQQTNPLVDNLPFLQKLGYLSVISSKGPFKNLNFNEAINGLKVIDNPADIVAGDQAFTATKKGIVVSNVLAGQVRTITVDFPMVFKPAGVTIDEWNVAANRKETVIYTISVTPNTGQQQTNRTHNPWLVLATIGAMFARNVNAEDFVLQKITPATIQQGGPATVLDLNVAGASVQKTVANVNSGTPVVTDVDGKATIPNGNTTGQVIRFVVTKAGMKARTFGPYTVAAP